MSVLQTNEQSKICIVDTRAEIETPENVILTFDLAGPGSRAYAYTIDLAIRIGVGWGLMYLLQFLIPLLGIGHPIGFVLVGFFFLEWGYTSLFEGLCNGQTPGKKMLKLRVIKDAGYPIHFYDAALRNLLRAADFLPVGYGVGLLSMTATKKMQRIGDLVAGTIVVRADVHTYKRNPAAFRSVEPILPSECDRRFHLSERTLDVIEQLLWRRESLGRRRVEEIASILAQPIADQLGYNLGENKNGARDILFLRRVLKTFSTSDQGA